jgi:hypothetical protein
MTDPIWTETFVEQEMTYPLYVEDRFIIVENVPVRVCLETGEMLFAPETVERLQHIAWKQLKPNRIIETAVYEFL